MKKNNRSGLILNVTNVASTYNAIIVGSIALVINLIVLVDYQKSPYSRFLLWDAANYWKWALEIAGGNWLGISIFHQAPLYPYLLAIFIFMFGENLLPIYLFQCAISVATSVAVYSICVKISRNKTAGLLAGLLYAFYGMQVFYTTKIFSECIAAFLLVLTVRLLLSGRFLNSTLLSGFFLGLFLLAKPHFLIAVPLVVIYYYIISRRNGMPFLLKRVCWFLIPLGLVISTATIRNFIVGREFVLICGNGGENFYIGNNDRANGTYVPIEGISSDIAYQDADVVAAARSAEGKRLTRSKVSRYWFRKGIAFITRSPSKYLALQWTKLNNFFSGAELTNMYIMEFERKYLTHAFSIPFINFYLILPLCCVGFFAAIRQWTGYYLIFAMPAVNMLSMMIFFYDTRFMIITMPFFILLSGNGLWNIIERFSKAGSIKKAVLQPPCIAFFFGIGLVAIIYARDRKFPDQDWRLWMSLGDIYFGIDNIDRSIEYYIQASELNKRNCMPAFRVSKALFKQGNRDVAVQLYTSTFKTVGSDDRKTILRDRDFDPLREYAREKSRNGMTGK